MVLEGHPKNGSGVGQADYFSDNFGTDLCDFSSGRHRFFTSSPTTVRSFVKFWLSAVGRRWVYRLPIGEAQSFRGDFRTDPGDFSGGEDLLTKTRTTTYWSFAEFWLADVQ